MTFPSRRISGYQSNVLQINPGTIKRKMDKSDPKYTIATTPYPIYQGFLGRTNDTTSAFLTPKQKLLLRKIAKILAKHVVDEYKPLASVINNSTPAATLLENINLLTEKTKKRAPEKVPDIMAGKRIDETKPLADELMDSAETPPLKFNYRGTFKAPSTVTSPGSSARSSVYATPTEISFTPSMVDIYRNLEEALENWLDEEEANEVKDLLDEIKTEEPAPVPEPVPALVEEPVQIKEEEPEIPDLMDESPTPSVSSPVLETTSIKNPLRPESSGVTKKTKPRKSEIQRKADQYVKKD